ncbi:hypothetical protein BX600DRAFT_110196 [Xylariales sp. PMI_506]|nr:hypothetical protein BX600DRAFT_110196 [Xylariales sp. PMI_506]
MPSLFLQLLLPEIRSIVYEYVFGSRYLHMFVYEQKLVSLPCRNPGMLDSTSHEVCIGMPMSESPGYGWDPKSVQQKQSNSNHEHHTICALLTVCRTIYKEAVDALYRTHNFHFNNLISITVFPRAMLRQHLDAVHHIRISLALFIDGNQLYAYLNNSFSRTWPGWDETKAPGDTPWQCAWSTIRDMKSLHTLVVTLEVNPYSRMRKDQHWTASMAADFETLLFQPLKEVTCNDFLLRVNWPLIESSKLQKYPFRIERFDC